MIKNILSANSNRVYHTIKLKGESLSFSHAEATLIKSFAATCSPGEAKAHLSTILNRQSRKLKPEELMKGLTEITTKFPDFLKNAPGGGDSIIVKTTNFMQKIKALTDEEDEDEKIMEKILSALVVIFFQYPLCQLIDLSEPLLGALFALPGTLFGALFDLSGALSGALFGALFALSEAVSGPRIALSGALIALSEALSETLIEAFFALPKSFSEALSGPSIALSETLFSLSEALLGGLF